MATATEVIETPSASRWTPTVRGWTARLVVLFGIFAAVILITATVPQYWADRIALAVIYAIIGLSLNIVLGYVGQVSLGHHGFVGIAAFIAAYYVSEKAGCGGDGCNFAAFSTAMVLAAASGALAAGLLGLVALRIRGLYLALITLAYGFMAETSIFEIPFLTRSGAGMPAVRPDGFTSDRAFAFLTFFFLAGVLYLDWRLLKSKAGRAILSLKHSEPVAMSYGINVTAFKTFAFVLSGMFAGIAGGLFAFQSTNVVSNNFNFNVALLWVLMVVIGGLGNRTGVVIGSMFFALFPFLVELSSSLEHFVKETMGRDPSYFSLVLGAGLAVLTIIQFPGGIAEQISPITRWLRGEKFSMHPEGHGKRPKSEKRKALLERFKRAEHTQDDTPTDGEAATASSPATAPTGEMPAATAEKETQS
ncbi:MAG TPA: branched-chain amino acid ABC transporter permease [Actinomycetota bacterium]|nr:branched-chain amino acid ABC transporter permease [Actinomycetota bacterium]